MVLSGSILGLVAKTTVDLPGSSDASVSMRAVPSPPASPAAFAFTGCLFMAFHVFERVGVRTFITRLI
jgi:hypothetical protein